MILESLFRLFFGLLDFFISLFPDVDLNLDLSSLGALTDVFGYADTFIDMRVVAFCAAASLIVLNWSVFARLFNFIIRKIPGIG